MWRRFPEVAPLELHENENEAPGESDTYRGVTRRKPPCSSKQTPIV